MDNKSSIQKSSDNKTFESDREKFMKAIRESDPDYYFKMSQTMGFSTGNRPASECCAPLRPKK